MEVGDDDRTDRTALQIPAFIEKLEASHRRNERLNHVYDHRSEPVLVTGEAPTPNFIRICYRVPSN